MSRQLAAAFNTWWSQVLRSRIVWGTATQVCPQEADNNTAWAFRDYQACFYSKYLASHQLPTIYQLNHHIDCLPCLQFLMRVQNRELAAGIDAFKHNVVWQMKKRTADQHFFMCKGRQVCRSQCRENQPVKSYWFLSF